MRVAIAAAMSLVLAGCAGTGEGPVPAAAVAATPGSSFACESEFLAVDTAFPGGALSSCTIDDAGNVTIVIAPEDEPPINCSAWYAFRITPRAVTETQVTLTYTACGHRYWPKTSNDFAAWDYVPADDVEVDEFAGLAFARVDLQLGAEPLFVAGQEVLPQETYDNWMRSKAAAGQAQQFVLGDSAEGREIGGIAIGNAGAREVVVLVGRQHPPEVTGALAMFPFMETLMGDSELARSFRQRFLVVAVPILNPDGVARGHWRHNTGGVDLNRDWGPFTQPETQLMQGLLDAIAANEAQDLQLMIDFHSTQHDVFYTIPDELPTDPELFTSRWLARYGELMPGYAVNVEARHSVGSVVSKAYVYDTFGAPGVTFELGDETDRELIQRIGVQGAVAMMETLLADEPQ